MLARARGRARRPRRPRPLPRSQRNEDGTAHRHRDAPSSKLGTKSVCRRAGQPRHALVRAALDPCDDGAVGFRRRWARPDDGDGQRCPGSVALMVSASPPSVLEGTIWAHHRRREGSDAPWTSLDPGTARHPRRARSSVRARVRVRRRRARATVTVSAASWYRRRRCGCAGSASKPPARPSACTAATVLRDWPLRASCGAHSATRSGKAPSRSASSTCCAPSSDTPTKRRWRRPRDRDGVWARYRRRRGRNRDHRS